MSVLTQTAPQLLGSQSAQLAQTGMVAFAGGSQQTANATSAELFAALLSTAPPGVESSRSRRRRRAAVPTFSSGAGTAAWVIKVGPGADPAARLPRARDCAQALAESDVYCCALVDMPTPPASVAPGGAAIDIMLWSRRVSGGACVSV